MVKGTTELEIQSLKFSTALIYPSGISRSPLGALSAIVACALSPFLSLSSRWIHASRIETAKDRGEGEGTETEREDIERAKMGGTSGNAQVALLRLSWEIQVLVLLAFCFWSRIGRETVENGNKNTVSKTNSLVASTPFAARVPPLPPNFKSLSWIIARIRLRRCPVDWLRM